MCPKSGPKPQTSFGKVTEKLQTPTLCLGGLVCNLSVTFGGLLGPLFGHIWDFVAAVGRPGFYAVVLLASASASLFHHPCSGALFPRWV